MLLCESGLLLLFAEPCVKTVPFASIDRWLQRRRGNRRGNQADANADINLVELSVSRAARLFPWDSKCLSRSIVIFTMLRRRGIPAVLLTGARFGDDRSLTAHAWVDTGVRTIGKDPDDDSFAELIRIGEMPGKIGRESGDR